MNKDKNSANLWQKFASTYKQEKHRENNLDADLYCYEHIETPGTNVNEWIIERKRVQPFFQLISKTPFFLAQRAFRPRIEIISRTHQNLSAYN